MGERTQELTLELVERLEGLRADEGLNYGDMATRIGVSRKTLWAIVAGSEGTEATGTHGAGLVFVMKVRDAYPQLADVCDRLRDAHMGRVPVAG